MFGVPGDEIEGVEKNRRKGPQAIGNTAQRPGQIHNQAFSPHPANAPRKRGVNRPIQAAQTDEFGEPRRLPVDDSFGGLGGHIPRPQTRAPRGDHQVCARGREDQKFTNPIRVVLDHERTIDGKAQIFEALSGLRPGLVGSAPVVNGIAHRDDHGGFGLGYHNREPGSFSTPRIQRAHDRRLGVISCLLAVLGLLQPAGETYSLRAVVLDSKGAPVRDLELSDVALTEGGANVPLTRFEKDERPSRVALLIDSSQPMASAYRLQFIDAAKAFVAALPSNTRLSIWTTGDRPVKVIDDLSLEEDGVAKTIASGLTRTPPSGGNTILDAIVEASQDLAKKEGERKIVVFISAVGPGFSNDNRQSIVDRVLKTGVEVAGALVSETGESAGGGEVSTEEYDYVFGTLTEKTGGRLERPLTVMGLGVAMARVAADLRSTYRLTFHSSGNRRSKVALQVARPAVKVRLSAPQKETSSP